MEPEDYDDDFSDDDQPTYVSSTLTQGAPVVIETFNDSIFIGEIIAITQPGIILLQKMSEVTPDDLQSDSAPDLILANPIETFIPFTSIHYVQSVSDISAEAWIDQLRSDLDNYHNPPDPDQKEDPEDPEQEEKETPWDQFINILDRILKKLGV